MVHGITRDNILEKVITLNAHGTKDNNIDFLLPDNIYVMIPHAKGTCQAYSLRVNNDKSIEEQLYDNEYYNFYGGWKLYRPGDKINNINFSPFKLDCHEVASQDLQKNLARICSGNDLNQDYEPTEEDFSGFCPLYCTKKNGDKFEKITYNKKNKLKIKACGTFDLNSICYNLPNKLIEIANADYKNLTDVEKENISPNKCDNDNPIIIIPFTCNSYVNSTDNFQNWTDINNTKSLWYYFYTINATIEADAIEARAIEDATIKARAIKDATIEAKTIKDNHEKDATIEADTIEAATIEAATIEADTIKAATIEAATIKAETIEAATIKAATIEATAIHTLAFEALKINKSGLPTGRVTSSKSLASDNKNTAIKLATMRANIDKNIAIEVATKKAEINKDIAINVATKKAKMDKNIAIKLATEKAEKNPSKKRTRNAGIKRKHKSRKHKSRKHKSRKHKSRKHKSRKHKSRLKKNSKRRKHKKTRKNKHKK